MSDLVYLYGFVPADATAPPRDVAGVAERPVRLLDLGDVGAVVSDVPADAYSPAQLEARLQDLGWVGEQGMAHERVVVWFADNSEILPARMFSLYSGEAALREAAGARHGEVLAALRALSGRREWNLKVAFDRDELMRHGAEISPGVAQMDEEIATASPGRRYLLERRRNDVLKEEVSRAARSLAHEVLDSLREHAEGVQILPVADTDESGTVVLNAALLVTRDAEAALRATADDVHARYTALGLVISFSGPWAPYRFVEVYGET